MTVVFIRARSWGPPLIDTVSEEHSNTGGRSYAEYNVHVMDLCNLEIEFAAVNVTTRDRVSDVRSFKSGRAARGHEQRKDALRRDLTWT